MTSTQITALIALLVALAIGIVWLIFWVHRGLVKGRAAAAQAADREGFFYQVRCEECGNERQASYAEATQGAMNKSKGVTAEAQVGLFDAGGTHYTSFSKKMLCPQCGRKTWQQLLNYNGHDAQALKNTANSIGPILINGAIGLVGLTAIVMVVFSIVLPFMR